MAAEGPIRGDGWGGSDWVLVVVIKRRLKLGCVECGALAMNEGETESSFRHEAIDDCNGDCRMRDGMRGDDPCETGV